MTDESKPAPSLEQLEAAALRLIDEHVLSKGGVMPSEKAVEIAAKMMAKRAQRELKSKQMADPSPAPGERLSDKSSDASGQEPESPAMCSNLLAAWIAQDQVSPSQSDSGKKPLVSD